MEATKELFTHIELENGMYAITAPMGEQCYVILGEEKALIFDNGMGFGGLKSYVEKITDLPLVMVTSHGHPDHAGGNGEFDQVYMHSADRETFEEMCTVAYRLGDVEKINADLVEGMRAITVPYVGNFTAIDQMQTIDLGKRSLDIIHTPGHTRGSICLYDKLSRTLFAGDMLNEQTWMYLDYSTDIQTYYDSLRSIYVKNWDIQWIQTGHSNARICEKRLQDMIGCAQEILEGKGKEQEKEMTTFAGKGMWHGFGDGGILYNPARIRENNDEILG
ncbi:MAG: MBL fold metallo-hydrolase [Lachnospiraceae bacterium]|nr:MBL fold metallo-hydrolase [Lachnospiraceae bacterium]